MSLNSIEDKSIGIISLCNRINEHVIIRYLVYFVTIVLLYLTVIAFVFPGNFAIFVPHHSDILDYPYDINGLGINVFSQGSRPIGLILTWLFGIIVGYKGVMLSGIIITFCSMLLVIYCVEKELKEKLWFGAIVFYILFVFTSSSFYLNYTFDIYNVYALFFSLLTIALWYRTLSKSSIWHYPIVFALGLSSFLCKETYIITLCFFFFIKIFLERDALRKRAFWFFALCVLSAGVAFLQIRIANNAFSSMQIQDISHPYYTSFSPGNLLKTGVFYIQAFDNPFVIAVIIIAAILLIVRNKQKSIGLLLFSLSGLFAYLPYMVLPNHLVPHYFFVAYIVSFSIILSIQPKKINKGLLIDKRRASAIIFFILTFLSIMNILLSNTSSGLNRFNHSRWWIANESAMYITLNTARDINAALQPGDIVLVVGIEPFVETAFRAGSSEKMFRSDVHFFVVTDFPMWAGPISKNVTYIASDETKEIAYSVVIDYSNNSVEITRHGSVK